MIHKPIMLKESIKFLDIKQEGLYVDFTYGYGGHSSEILKYLNKKGKLISIDKDFFSYLKAKKISKEKKTITAFNLSFDNLKDTSFFMENIDGVILDLGLSLNQIKNKNMGLCFNKNSYLDMRINQENTHLRASDWLNFVKEAELKIFLNFFLENRISHIITKNIINFRKIKLIRTSKDLCYIITKSINKKNIKNISIIFTLVKILITNELFSLSILLKNIKKLIKKNGIIVLISFNSLEDKIIKNTFVKKYHITNLKFIINRPTSYEINDNYSSRSAIMRIFKKN